LGPDRDETLDA